ncbi:MAG: CHAD domain-containing protein, partial [Planctomycetota bacterium]
PAAGVADAAAMIVARRLARVPEMISAIDATDELRPEHVHQLRVSTRRADAALRAFRPSFGPRRWKRLRKRLRRLRREAAEARKVDVHLEDLIADRKAHKGADRKLFDIVIARTRDMRPSAAKLVRRGVERDPARKVRRATRKLLDSVDAEPGASRLRDFAEERLRVHLEEIVEVAGHTLDWEGLHELRLVGKRLRYSMELFALPLDDPSLLDLYEIVSELQSKLGRINDAHELAELVDAVAASEHGSTRKGLVRLAEEYRQRRQTLRDEFVEWWDEAALQLARQQNA